MFTLFIKATTIGFIAKKLDIDKLHALEEFEYFQAKMLMHIRALRKLEEEKEKNLAHPLAYEELILKYQKELEILHQKLKEFCKQYKTQEKDIVHGALMLHALSTEKQYLKDLYEYHEIDEYNFKVILGKITRQIDKIES